MSKKLICLITLVLAVGHVEVLQGVTVLENFDSNPSWNGSGNKTSGNDYGYQASLSNEASGINPGEAGGTFKRTGSFTYYADTDLGGSLDTSSGLTMTGKIDVTAAIPDPGSDRNILGYFDINSEMPTMLGIRICDPKNSLADWRIRLYSINGTGEAQGSPSGVGAEMTVNGDYSFEWSYEPTIGAYGRLTMRITTSNGSIWVGNSDTTASKDETITYDLPSGHGTADPTASFNAFGMGVFKQTSNPYTAYVYFDDLGYIVLKMEEASKPDPADGALYEDTWVNISWGPGTFAVSHDVYLGDNFDDVKAGAESTFRGNQAATFFVAGFPGFPYPDGLVPGTTYYWRIDEVNDTEPNSPWNGDVWSFSIPPKTAYFPGPADGAESVDLNVELSWTGGFGSKLHTVYFGDKFDDVNNATGELPQGSATYTPGTLKMAKTYYWRVDEFDATDTFKGHVWSFTTQGAVGNPNPSNGAVDVKQTPILSWSPGIYAASHQVYFGKEDKEAVKNADAGSPEYKGSGNFGSESYDAGNLEWNTTYYWRIDEVNNVNPDSPWTGNVWSFTTANFLIVDDFEDYDVGNNEIWWAWIDGLGYASHPTLPAHPGNGTGSMVGDETTGSYMEETIVHGGGKSLPVFYDNSILRYSEVEKTLTYPRDWTEKGVNTLTIWFRGNSDNAAETLYVVLNGTAVVSHDNPDAAQVTTWTEWTIDLQAFGVNLANVNTIGLGLGDRNNPQAGGSGVMYFDDIRLYPPPPEPTP